MFEQGKHGPLDFTPHLLPPHLGCDYVQLDLHVWLQSQQISHPQQAGVNSGRVLDFECTCHRASLEPQHVNLLYRIESGVIVIQWQ